MGRTGKRLNSKSRSATDQKNLKIQEEIQIDLNVGKEKFDASNPLVYDASKKKKNEEVEKKVSVPKPLSKKQRKKLERVVERKKRKLTRAELFEKLSQVQAKPEELKVLTSTSTMQTHGLKRSAEEISEETSQKKFQKINNIKGINKKNKMDLKLESSESSSDSDISGDESQDVNGGEGEIKEPSTTKAVKEAPIEEKAADSGELDTGVKIASGPEVKLPKKTETVACKPAVYITVKRKPEIQAARESLPIFSEEQSIIEAIKENPVVIIHGETGSGKTTQVPQFLYEAGFTQDGKTIGITEPRRIAAMTMATRVGEEMNMPDKVSYHIRYEKTVGKDTEIKFMTDGVLLKEIRHDFFLSKYSVILIDEAHERSVFSDVLIGLLSRIVVIREKRKDPLKLVIMSATIRVEDFTDNPKLFKIQPFLIRVSSRQHRVQVHFNLHTPDDYVEAAYHKVCKVHQQLPPGAILVFLTGEKEVQRLCKMLERAFPFKNKGKLKPVQEHDKSVTSIKTKSLKKKRKPSTSGEGESFCDLPKDFNLDDYSVEPLDKEDLQHQHSDDEETETVPDSFEVKFFETKSPLYALPLYSILPFKEQEKVFKPPPLGSRLCVVATNVAETSITIPGLKYVVDSGKVKTKVYHGNGGGISQFQIVWCSKASSNQRAGRCGRTEGGHCYRLYSSSVFQHDFPDFSLPEIQSIPVDDVLLQMKALGIDRVVEFPFPSPPEKEALKAAERRLVILGALQDLKKGEKYKDLEKWEFSAKVTPLGKAMSRFPLSPRYAKMLLLSYKHKCIPYIVAIVCALTVPELFVTSTITTEREDGEEEVKVVQEGIHKFAPGTGPSARLGDVMVLLQAVASFENSRHGARFCIKNGIRFKAMAEIHKMAIQLLREMNRAFPDTSTAISMKIDPPSPEQLEKIRAIVAACLIDNVARKLPRDDTKDDKNLKNAYKCLDSDDPVFIHPASTLFSVLPDYVVYNEISQSTKLYMKGVLEVEPEWLPAFSPNLCDFSEPSEDPPPRYDSVKDRVYCSMGGTFGPWQWNLPMVTMEMQRGLLKYSWFCFFLLDGQVCSFFNNYKSHYLSAPSIMMKTWAKLLPRTRYLLQAIIAKEVDSRDSLRKMWETDPKYLLREFWEWLPVDKHTEVELKWPPNL